ncbi:MAG: hypothetical protein M1415_02405 [Firmicutes bacterium]|nr:hypothetical protein [Bacillota bacterium]
MMHIAQWLRYRIGRRLTRRVLIGGLSLGGIVFGCGGIFAAQSPHVTFVPLTQRVQAVVHTLTPIPLALPMGLPVSPAIRSVYGPTHHWVITGTANARGYNIVWAPRWPRADTSVIDIAPTAATLRQLETRHPPTGERGTGLWTFVGETLPHPEVAPWNIPYAPNRRQAWRVDLFDAALAPKKVPGTMTAEILGRRRLFKITQTADGHLFSFVWYQRGWLVTLIPYPLNHNRHLSAQVQVIADQVAHLPRITQGAGVIYEQIGSGGPYVSWMHGAAQYTVANSVSVRAVVALLNRLPARLF